MIFVLFLFLWSFTGHCHDFINKYSLSFDGGDVATGYDNEAIQNVWDGGATVSFWVKTNSSTTHFQRFLEKGSWRIIITDPESSSANRFFFQQDFSTTNGRWQSVGYHIVDNVWLHVVVTYNSSDIANNPVLYVNSSSVSFTEELTPSGTRTTDAASNLLIGNSPSGGSHGLNGLMDEIVIFPDDILSDLEVRTLYNNGIPLDSRKIKKNIIQIRFEEGGYQISDAFVVRGADKNSSSDDPAWSSETLKKGERNSSWRRF